MLTQYVTATAGFLAATIANVALAETHNTNRETENKAVIEQSFKAWASGTGSPYEILADDATWTITGKSLASKTYKGREEFLSAVIRPFNARMSVGLKPTIRSIHAEGETVIILFDAKGTASDGQPYENTYAWFLDIKDGQVKKAVAFFDSVAFNDLWQRVQPVQSAMR